MTTTGGGGYVLMTRSRESEGEREGLVKALENDINYAIRGREHKYGIARGIRCKFVSFVDSRIEAGIW